LPLARHFLQRFSESIHNASSKFTHDAELALLAYPWPGNVRELRNAIERAVLLSSAKQPVALAALPPLLQKGTTPAADLAKRVPLQQQVEAFEREVIRAALHTHGGVLRQAAKSLGMNPVTLGRKAKHYGLVAQAGQVD
jgi:DNA-binding NtrC family response regulator